MTQNKTCEEKYTEYDNYVEISCGKEPADWCKLRGIWICKRCCESCYTSLYPEGCMEAEYMFK